MFKQKLWFGYNRMEGASGFVEHYYESDESFCMPTDALANIVIIPGTMLLSRGGMGVALVIFICWLFLGIAIIADIFMEAIEQITSQTVLKEVWSTDGKQKYFVEHNVWNPTLANLSLMALGSSAPEIFISVIETCQTLG